MIDKKAIHKAAAISSKLEGLSLNSAKKDIEAIKILNSYGRGFAL